MYETHERSGLLFLSGWNKNLFANALVLITCRNFSFLHSKLSVFSSGWGEKGWEKGLSNNDELCLNFRTRLFLQELDSEVQHQRALGLTCCYDTCYLNYRTRKGRCMFPDKQYHFCLWIDGKIRKVSSLECYGEQIFKKKKKKRDEGSPCASPCSAVPGNTAAATFANTIIALRIFSLLWVVEN